jgi:heme/copper-type cytochrome/quinol oxidase subunit 2
MLNKKSFLLPALVSLLWASQASADATGWKVPANTFNLPDQDFGSLIITIINWMLGFIVLLAILVIIYGSVIYIASSGDQQRVDQAKKTIKYALMGLIMSGLAWAIVNVVVTTFVGGTK